MVTERRRPRVGPFQGVEHAADAVERAADDQQDQRGDACAVHDRADEPGRDPAQQDVERHTEPARRRRPEHLEQHTRDSARPDDPEQHHAVVRRQGQQGERGVTARDEHEDHRVVGTLHPLACGGRLPIHPVIRAADGEHRDDRERVEQRREARPRANHRPGHRHQRGAADERDHGRVDMDPAARTRLAEGLGDPVDDGLGEVLGAVPWTLRAIRFFSVD